MVASLSTLQQVADIIVKYVPPEDLGPFMLALLAVKGNKSFEKSIEALDELIGS